MKGKWRDLPRDQRFAVIGACLGMVAGAFAVFEYAYNGTTLDRYLIMCAGLLGGGALGLLLGKITTPKQPS